MCCEKSTLTLNLLLALLGEEPGDIKNSLMCCRQKECKELLGIQKVQFSRKAERPPATLTALR